MNDHSMKDYCAWFCILSRMYLPIDNVHYLSSSLDLLLPLSLTAHYAYPFILLQNNSQTCYLFLSFLHFICIPLDNTDQTNLFE